MQHSNQQVAPVANMKREPNEELFIPEGTSSNKRPRVRDARETAANGRETDVNYLNPKAPRIATNHVLYPGIEQQMRTMVETFLRSHGRATTAGLKNKHVGTSCEEINKYTNVQDSYP
ncbi:hypothetical protein CLAFUW4_03274 [Fulvia fulva]|uniref:Uncharacterized protein n=1 Tax=Passalora fulva TaxID=5499 RepID=A0A9Q8LBD4_PASFU|nr:uncharacterized protein CLAFUR5_03255 [Fulvia fulva]KAK4631394.1 hypothetical protein CLAFUR4_03263 [Fulvia fulva]KAK4632565.1 hypothetical protein CLAFUR0_03267 [Fulvia fulva]UJO14260.1 hypothetical protein CLAFUR5_03255 [Fulvia fulva]WPV11961.1 hypothetical protein CLAFUW4_03274 [Fulvia fulva]WPV25532.1 hypothetical protein CLAFUW7_03267 [Fulvia fulva]